MGSILSVIAATIGTIVGFTTQNASIVFWTEAAISPFGILAFANIFFPLIFALFLCLWALRQRSWSVFLLSDRPRERSLCVCGSTAQLALLVGLFNILNGFGIVYSSNPERTPPLVQAILQNTGVVWSIPFSLFLLGDRKRYYEPLALLACALITASVVVSVLPTILAGSASLSVSSIGWIFLYLCSIAPGAAYNVLQQRILIKAGALKEGADNALITTSMLRMLFYTNCAQTLSLWALFWLDLLPWFGTSQSLLQFWNNTVFSLSCSFAGAGGAVAAAGSGLDPSSCGAQTNLWSFVFIGGYTITYICSAILNRESATYNMLVNVLTTTATSAFWLIPGTNPAPGNTPLWSVLPSLALSIAGVVLWKAWESRTPSHAQFAYSDDAGYEPLGYSDVDDVGGSKTGAASVVPLSGTWYEGLSDGTRASKGLLN